MIRAGYAKVGGSLFAMAALFAACSTDTGTPYAGNGGSSASGGSEGADAAASGGSGGTPQPDAYVPIDTGLGDGASDDAETCSAVSQTGEHFPVDMYIMMDKSGSMNEAAGSQTKWQAVTEALTAFLQDPSSAGLGVGIQFFPLPVNTSMLPCFNTITCPSNNICVTDAITNDGACHGMCPGTGTCGPADCVPTGNPIFPGYCSNDTCDSNAYRQPVVEIGNLPANAGALIGAMQAQSPLGGTPTYAALIGAIQHTQEWVAQHIEHKTIVVLATDGAPTLCPVASSAQEQANTIELCKQAASNVLNGNPPIQTFVIGVGDLQANLDAIAAAGGTDHAYIVDPAQDVAQQFADALAAIRGNVMTCEFKLPEPDATTGEVDYGKVNVEHTSSGGDKETIYYVENEAACDPVTGGWYYDTDPTQGTPTRINLCPKTCETVQADPNAQVDIAIGCASVTAPK